MPRCTSYLSAVCIASVLVSRVLTPMPAAAADPSSPSASASAKATADKTSRRGWPQWRGPNRNGVSTEAGLAEAWPANGPPVLWKAESLGNGYGSAAVAGGTVYVAGSVGGEGRLTAITTAGKARWTCDYGPEHAGVYPGARTTPTVAGEFVYVVSGTGVVSCVQAASGELVWRKDMVSAFGGRPTSKWGFGESVLVDGDRVICTPGGKEVTCVALDRRTGDVVWKSPGLDQRHAACSPALVKHGGRRIIITQLVRHIIALSADTGKRLWEFEAIQDGHHDDAVKAFSPVCADGYVFTSCRRTKLGSVRLQMADDATAVTTSWSQPRFVTGIGAALLHNGRLYGALEQRGWMCVDWKTGEALHESREIAGGSSGACIAAGNLLYCLGLNGRLDLVKITPDGLEVAGTFIAPGAPKDKHWAHPSLADGVLYVRHKATLLALDVRAGHAGEMGDD